MNWVLAGSIGMFLGVGWGAFGAHGLKNKLTPQLLQIFETGVRYQIYHALALFVVAWMGEKNPASMLTAGGWAFVVGIFLFSGSLYLYALSGFKPLVYLTPLGGFSFLLGWLFLIIAALRE